MSGAVQDWPLPGTASDQVPEIVATGHPGLETMFLSLSRRHPEGADAEYLHWHSLDHRPEQHRLPGLGASLRIVSTPACRAARAASDESLDATDHVMTYFFQSPDALAGFGDLSTALRDAGRSPFICPPVDRGVFAVNERLAAPRARAGAEVLPWRPARGVYLLIERGDTAEAAHALVEVPGVAGLWSAASQSSPYASLDSGHRLTYCFLDGDPVETAERLRPLLEQRWRPAGVQPLLAAPFHCIVPFEWDRFLP